MNNSRLIVNTLQRRLDPRLVATLGSVLLTVRRRERCVVRYAEGNWAHHYTSGIVVRPELGGASARQEDRASWDTFLFGYQPRVGDTVLDIGAGVGSETRLLSRLVGRSGRVISVEAHPRMFACLCRTIELNGLENVTAVSGAIAGRRGTVYIQDLPNHASNAITTRPGEGLPVPAETLGELLDRLDVDQVDLLKMNIEGVEHTVLEAAQDVLARVRNIVVSCHDFKAESDGGDWQRTHAEVRSLLIECGYRLLPSRRDPRPWIPYYVYASRPQPH
ncbi:FkbM family methyltransferase [Saccharothrix sp.]|uniref:FkbM family methyltransferase n=1 Tax=Saccharothrix sp. TaxID=1873460 RepID=UPI0028116725|nr:FkbM family methyltransferase [Saccharothrix sp.]